MSDDEFLDPTDSVAVPRKTATAIAPNASQTQTTLGTPSVVPLAKLASESGVVMNPDPPTHELTAPCSIPFMASVMTMGDIPSTLTPAPLIEPTTTQSPSDARIAPTRPIDGAQELVTIAAMVIVHGTDRSMPPTRSTNISEIPSIPRTDACANSDWV